MANPNERILNLQREPLVVGAGGAVNSVNGQTGDVVLNAEDVGALPDSTVIPTKTSDLENDSDFQTGDEVNQAIGLETTARENADNGLQGQIDALSAASDVTDIVGTYADLQAYDTSKLKDNDIIKVLQDENQNDETTYYRWSTSTETFTLIGEEGPYYTKAAADQKFQDKLTAGSNITIDANNEISATDTTYSNFVGTDGVNAGTAGLVPAPAVSDAGKYLKADGTWDTVSAGPTVVQTTGTSTTDVMSQKAASNLVYPAGAETNKSKIAIGASASAGNGSNGIAIGQDAVASQNGSIALGWGATSIGQSVALGRGSITTRAYEVAVGSGAATNGTRYIANVTDPTQAQDAATKNYTDNLVINYSAINGSAAPTTATEGKYVGQLYYDTTNEQLYFLKEIDTTVDPVEYTWEAVGGGSSVNVVQTTGTSQTDVMSQVATTNMIYPSGYETSQLRMAIGKNAVANSNDTIAIGYNAAAYNNYSMGIGRNTYALTGTAIGYSATATNNSLAVGRNATATANDSVAIGPYSKATSRAYEFSIGSGISGTTPVTRYIANVTDPTQAQDAATKNYVDSIYPVGAVFTSTSATAPTIAGGTWTEIGTQTIGSSTVHYYERTA